MTILYIALAIALLIFIKPSDRFTLRPTRWLLQPLIEQLQDLFSSFEILEQQLETGNYLESGKCLVSEQSLTSNAQFHCEMCKQAKLCKP
jgi:hypothetical protein